MTTRLRPPIVPPGARSPVRESRVGRWRGAPSAGAAPDASPAGAAAGSAEAWGSPCSEVAGFAGASAAGASAGCAGASVACALAPEPFAPSAASASASSTEDAAAFASTPAL